VDDRFVTTKRGELESPNTLKRRIDEAAKFVRIGRLCLSPQCGFSSTVEGNVLTADEQKAKLALIVQIAGEVRGLAAAPVCEAGLCRCLCCEFVL
jgi:5-methyltetrahydropteroyltriglutamate--homocysteine methyltransferase